MGKSGLGQLHFKTTFDRSIHKRNHYLALSNQQAFLALKDKKGNRKATASVNKVYETKGLKDAKGERRVVRAVKIPVGTKIYKFTGGLEKQETNGQPLKMGKSLNEKMCTKVLFAYDTVSPWWAPVDSFEEDTGGIREHFKNMVINSLLFKGPGELTMREYGRFMSAVVLEWNKLNYYVELELQKETQAYWGQFEEQLGTENLAIFTGKSTATVGWGWTKSEDVKIVTVGKDNFIVYKGDKKKYYLPDNLGGLGAWQFYIPAFVKQDIVVKSVKAIPSTDSEALAKHFGFPDIFKQAQAELKSFTKSKL